MRTWTLLSVVVLSAAILVFQGTALAGSSDGMVAVQSVGEANAVALVRPEGTVTMVRLRDGSELTVPSTVHLPGNVLEGSWINATVQQIEGKNIVTSLDVVADPGARSQGGS